MLFSLNAINAQANMKSFEEFLNAQLDENQLMSPDKTKLYPIYFKSPLIDEAEFRTQTNEFDLQQQEYTLRLSGNSKNIRKYQDAIYQDLKAEYFFELAQTQEDLIGDLYEQYLEHYFDLEKLNLRKQILPIYDDMITVLSKENIDGDLSVTDLIEASRKRDKIEATINFASEQLNQNVDLKGSSAEELITVTEMEKQLSSLLMQVGNNDAAVEKFELNKIEHQYQLEKAERDNRWDFAQIRYSGDPNDIWEEKVSIGLGFRFPHSSKNSLDMIELQLEKMIEEEKYNRRSIEFKTGVTQSYDDFLVQLNNYQASLSLIEKLKKYDELTKNIIPTSKREIIDILSLNIDAIEEELNVLDAKEDLYDSYINVLKKMGVFATTPRTNYLSTPN